MNKPLLKVLAMSLTLTVTLMSAVQMQAHAMLVPGHIAENNSESTLDRVADLEVIQKTLESKMIRERLKQLGLNEAEIQSRLAKMSDQEVHQFASQIRAVKPAGFVVWALTVVLLVVLIVFLVKRL